MKLPRKGSNKTSARGYLDGQMLIAMPARKVLAPCFSEPAIRRNAEWLSSTQGEASAARAGAAIAAARPPAAIASRNLLRMFFMASV